MQWKTNENQNEKNEKENEESTNDSSCVFLVVLFLIYLWAFPINIHIKQVWFFLILYGFH